MGQCRRPLVLSFGSASIGHIDRHAKTATIFVKSGDEFVRVAMNVKKDDGSRAIGIILDRKGKAIAATAKGESYVGEADILGKPYFTGYEPIRDAISNIIGVYYVGYLKN